MRRPALPRLPLTDGPAGPRWRWPLFAAGTAALAFGLQRLLTGGARTEPLSSGSWLAGSLIAHDAVLAPLTLVAGGLLMRTPGLSPALRRIAGGGLFTACCLLAVGLPALLTPGGGDNPTATPRDYGAGLTAALAADALAVAVLAAVAVSRGRARRTGGRRRSMPPTATSPAGPRP